MNRRVKPTIAASTTWFGRSLSVYDNALRYPGACVRMQMALISAGLVSGNVRDDH
jgi:hypothetical protein